MLVRFLRFSLPALSFATFASVAAVACTFPTVDYYEDQTPDPACDVTGNCANDAVRCGDDARRAYDACARQCTNRGAVCLNDCKSAFTMRLEQCSSVCQSCGKTQGCMNAQMSCSTLSGA
jgi:hypothetical protein